MTRRFTPRNAPRLSAEEAARQGRVTRLAVEALGASTAITFLNSVNPELPGRPLSVAVASEDGLRLVERLIAEQTKGDLATTLR